MKKVFLLFITINVSFAVQKNELMMNKNKLSQKSYMYKPETFNKAYTDWVTFKEPDHFVIERTLENGSKASCNTVLIAPILGGNAWTSQDLMQAISKKSIQKLLNSGIYLIRLTTTLDNEGKAQAFIFKWMNKTLTILPPDHSDNETPKADEDVAGLVYVLTKVYKQQLTRPECNAFNKLE